jgi:hypothetical protein
MAHLTSRPASITLLFWCIPIGLLLMAGCKTQELQTRWSAEPVKVDGEMTDWPSGSTVYFEDPGVQLGLRNDDQNLYLLVRFDNRSWARAIRMGGLTVWLDSSGKKKKDFGIRYFGGPSAFDMQKPGGSQGGGFRESLSPEQQQRLEEMEKARADQILVIDKKADNEIGLPADGSAGPAASSASSQDAYTYELSLPLRKGGTSGFGIGAEPGKIISLGFEWGGVSREDRQKMMESMGGGSPRGMGGGPHGGPGGGMPGGRRSGIKSAEKQELWVKTRLASPDGG